MYSFHSSSLNTAQCSGLLFLLLFYFLIYKLQVWLDCHTVLAQGKLPLVADNAKR